LRAVVNLNEHDALFSSWSWRGNLDVHMGAWKGVGTVCFPVIGDAVDDPRLAFGGATLSACGRCGRRLALAYCLGFTTGFWSRFGSLGRCYKALGQEKRHKKDVLIKSHFLY